MQGSNSRASTGLTLDWPPAAAPSPWADPSTYGPLLTSYFGDEELGRPADPVVGSAYALIETLADAIERAGPLDHDAVRDSIATTDGLSTIIGPIAFREDGTADVPNPHMQRIGGAIELIWPADQATADLVYPAPGTSPFEGPQTGGGVLRKRGMAVIEQRGGRMPVHRGKDSKGPYYQWGGSGKKYHYTSGDKTSREAAKKKAERQGRAARAGGYRG